MAKQQKSGKITIANVVSIVGIVFLTVFTFLGYSYKSGGELGWDIIKSCGITGVTVSLLWFMIKAKGAENNLKKWKQAEFATLIVYIIFSLSTSIFGGVMHFFVVNDQKNDIKNYATLDLNKIEAMFNEYKEFESSAITNTGVGLRNATGKGQLCDDRLNSFMSENGIEHNTVSAENFENIQSTMLVGEGFDAYFNEVLRQKNEILMTVESWSAMEIPSKASQIEDIATTAEVELTNLSNNAPLPTIKFNTSNRRYTIEGYQRREFKLEGGVDGLQFASAIKNADGFSLTALLVVLLLHTLILFNYIVAYRTSTIDIANYENDGGRIL